MRRLRIAVIAVAMAAALVGCTGEQGPTIPSAGGTPSESAEPDAQSQELEFVACMRDRGIADMPDPVPGDTSGRSAVRYALDVMGKGSDPVFQAALDDCLALLPPPDEPEPRSPDPDVLEALQEFAQCMREHGLPDFPDPDGPDPRFLFVMEGAAIEPMPPATRGEGGVVEVNLGDPLAADAWEACQPLFPTSASGWTVPE